MYEIFEHLLQVTGITTYKVCKDTGISQSTISSWKSSKGMVNTDTAKKIAQYFNVSIDYLMGLDTEEPKEIESPIERKVKIMTRKAEEHLTKEECEDLAEIYEKNILMYLKSKGITLDD